MEKYQQEKTHTPSSSKGISLFVSALICIGGCSIIHKTNETNEIVNKLQNQQKKTQIQTSQSPTPANEETTPQPENSLITLVQTTELTETPDDQSSSISIISQEDYNKAYNTLIDYNVKGLNEAYPQSITRETFKNAVEQVTQLMNQNPSFNAFFEANTLKGNEFKNGYSLSDPNARLTQSRIGQRGTSIDMRGNTTCEIRPHSIRYFSGDSFEIDNDTYRGKKGNIYLVFYKNNTPNAQTLQINDFHPQAIYTSRTDTIDQEPKINTVWFTQQLIRAQHTAPSTTIILIDNNQKLSTYIGNLDLLLGTSAERPNPSIKPRQTKKQNQKRKMYSN